MDEETFRRILNAYETSIHQMQDEIESLKKQVASLKQRIMHVQGGY